MTYGEREVRTSDEVMVGYEAGFATRVNVSGTGFACPSGHVLRTDGFALKVVAADEELQMEVTRGSVQPEQVLRLLYHDHVIERGESDGRLIIVIEASSATDTAVYTPGVRHRLLYRRTYSPAAPTVVWFGFNPFLRELRGDPRDRITRPSFRNVVGIATNHLGDVGTFTVLNLFTRRSDAAADIAADGADALTSDDLVRRSLEDADAVVGAWGGGVREAHLPQVRALWSLLDEYDLPLLVPSQEGRPLMTSTWPQQPRHPSRIGYRNLGLAPLPARWIETFRVDGTT